LTTRAATAIFRVTIEARKSRSRSFAGLIQSERTAELKEENPMKSRRTAFGGSGIFLMAVMMGLGLRVSEARADALYGITDLGTLSGQSSSVATGINNSGQVVGISYNSSDGYFTQVFPQTANPPRFTETGGGAQSFLYSNGQLTQINPTGGLAMSINNSGQAVGGQYSSINNLGQYVGGDGAGIITNNSPTTTNVLVSGGTTTTLPALFVPYSVNDSGQVAGFLIVDAHGGSDFHPAIYQNGQVTDLFSTVASGQYYDSRAIAINQNGDMIITVQPTLPQGQPVQSYLYSPATGQLTNITALPGGSGLLSAALNNKEQVVGNGFLYSNGTIQTLLSLIPAGSGWSNLNATGINDAVQIVGQGTYDGQQVAFMMTPDAVPEPGTLAIWGLIASCAGHRIWRGCPTTARAAE
jgi:uncharacterized membrane protein